MPARTTLGVFFLCTAVSVGASPLPQNKAIAREITVVATVREIDPRTRIVTVRNQDGAIQDILADPAVKDLNDLRVGDVVTVRFMESIVVQVRPGAKLETEKDTTSAARRAAGGENVQQQSRAIVTIDRIGPNRLSVMYRTADGQKIERMVEHQNLLDGIREGDKVEVTFTRERALSIERKRP
jgi:hypothetical protein